MSINIPGLHRVTAIASDPQRNLDFYIALLSLRFVKRTVNFDDPGSYHFYFGNNHGTPGTILTFSVAGCATRVRGTGIQRRSPRHYHHGDGVGTKSDCTRLS